MSPPIPLYLGASQSTVTKTSLFCLMPSKQFAATQKFEANRGLIHKAVKQGEEKKVSHQPLWRQGDGVLMGYKYSCSLWGKGNVGNSDWEKVWNVFLQRCNSSAVQFSSVQFSQSVLSDSLRPHELQRARPPYPSPPPTLPKLMSIKSLMPSNHLILCVPFFSRLQSFPASGFFQRVSSSHQVAKVLEFHL